MVTREALWNAAARRRFVTPQSLTEVPHLKAFSKPGSF